MGITRLKTKRLLATWVAMAFVFGQFLLAAHFHAADSDSHKAGTTYACAVCLAKAGSHDGPGPAPTAPALEFSPLQHFVGVVPALDVLFASVATSGKWARGPPVVASPRTAA